MKCIIHSVFILLIGSVVFSNADEVICKDNDSSLSCHGVRVMRNVMQRVLQSQENGNSALKLIPGLEIIEVPIDNEKRSINEIEDETIFGRLGRYLQTHEVTIKFPELMEKADFQEVISTAMKSLDEGKDVFEGRKKDKGGLGYIMMMGLMMGKMMAALGLGGVGALALKALGVSMMALMLAAIIGLKKLTESGHDDGGHHVQYVTAHSDHHRKKREVDNEIPLPYKGWSQYAVNN